MAREARLMVISLRGALAALAAIGGLLAVFGGTPYLASHGEIDVAALAAAVAHEDDHVTAVELAGWIRGRKPGLRVIDLQSDADFAAYHIPGAEHIPLQSLATAPFRANDQLVLYSAGGAHAAQAWVFLQARGYHQVWFLRGGVHEWLDAVMAPTIEANASPEAAAEFQKVAVLSRYFGGVPRIGETGAGQAIDHESTDAASRQSSHAVTAAEIRRRGC
jgi:rhodanese-related sulfurtransferase